MKKTIVRFLLAAVFAAALHAGDAAVFVDWGFSGDGNYYIFGQYGKTDEKFQGWAEIFTVDVEANEFIKSGVFTTKPSAGTAGKTGRAVYDALAAKSYYETKKYGCTPVPADRILYIRGIEDKSDSDTIQFTDFSGSAGESKALYRVRLVPEFSGSGVNISSSFFVELEKCGESGRILASQKIGSPKVVRKGVRDYAIERVACDKSGRNIVFVIEKNIEDKTGTNIRYMVETARLSAAFLKD